MTMAGGLAALGEVFTPEVADDFFERGERLRARLNAECERSGAAMGFSGMGTLIMTHFRPGPFDQPYMPTRKEEQQRELFFFDLLDAGFYLARRGMLALTLPSTDADFDRLVEAVARFLHNRRDVLDRHEPVRSQQYEAA